MFITHRQTIDSAVSVACDSRADNYQVTTTSATVTVKMVPVEGAMPIELGTVDAGGGAHFSVKCYSMVLEPGGSTEVTVVGY